MQLQDITHTKPLVVTFLLLTSLPLVNPTKVLQYLCTTHLGRRLLQGVSTKSSLDSLFLRIYHALSSTCLRVRLFFPFPAHSRYETFPTPEAEAKYWRISARYRRYLAHSSARQPPHETSEIPLVTYYTPRLLPQYREVRCSDQEKGEYSISSRTFCKWHRMVFRGSRHPTLARAAERMKYHSHEDLREIQRIARLLPDEDVFRVRRRWSPKYSKMWKRWLDNKGPDLVIVFE